MDDPTQSQTWLHQDLHTPSPNLYQLFDPLIFDSHNQELDAFGYDYVDFEASEFSAFEILGSSAFVSTKPAENHQTADNGAAHEIPQESLRLPAEEEYHSRTLWSWLLAVCLLAIGSRMGAPTCRSGRLSSIAADLTTVWVKQLRLERNEPTLMSFEPDPEMAWQYSNTYFERSVDSVFEVVHRPEFESRLRGHLGQGHISDDPADYALRNTVYASGCRLHHSANHAANFTDIQEEAWGYFSNALSVHSELLLRSPSLRAVRALLAMALFAEGLGSPALGSGLIANAVFLSQSLGMHRKVPLPDDALDSEALQRLWLFWSVYCCEKNIARRTGRPSVIDDDDINCDIPTLVHPRSTIDPVALRHIIRKCQISSRICRSLMSARNLDDQPAKFLDMLADFEQQLRLWKDSLPVTIRPMDRLCQLSPNKITLPETLLQCFYYDLVMVLHAPFTYPWITRRFRYSPGTNVEMKVNAQTARSTEAMANAARNIIIMARSFEITGANTHAFMLHYPMHAFINLFIYIMQSSNAESVRTDVALLDVAVGYFGRLDVVTGKVNFPFARDIAALGRQVVDKKAD